MLTAFFASRKLLVLDALSKGRKNNQAYFFHKAILELQCERFRFARRKTPVKFATQMHNSMCHNSMKVTNTLGKPNVIRARHPVYSLDLSSCDFSLVGMLKHRMMDQQLPSPKEILDAVAARWDEVTVEELQNVFLA
jgi:hypothetical protein